MPELIDLDPKESAVLAGVAPFNNDSGQFRGKRSTWGGRAAVRRALYMGAVSATRWNPAIRAFYNRLLDAKTPFKVAIVACMSELLLGMRAVIKSGKSWRDTTFKTA